MMRKSMVWLVMAVATVVAAAAHAQLEVPPGQWWERPAVAARIGLSDEQKVKLREVTIEHAKRMIDLKAAVEKAEIEVRVAAESEPFDADLLRAAFAKLQEARGRLEMERFELLVSQRELLTAPQWERLRALARETMRRRRDARQQRDLSRPPRQPNGPARF